MAAPVTLPPVGATLDNGALVLETRGNAARAEARLAYGIWNPYAGATPPAPTPVLDALAFVLGWAMTLAPFAGLILKLI